MEQRKYRANTLREAKLKMLLDVGKRGYIVNQKSIRTGGFFGLFGKPMVEITVNVLTSSDIAGDSSTNVDYMDNDLGFGVMKNNGNFFQTKKSYIHNNSLKSNSKSYSNGKVLTKDSKKESSNEVESYRSSLDRIKEIGMNLSKLEQKSSAMDDDNTHLSNTDTTSHYDDNNSETQIREELAKLKSMLLEIKTENPSNIENGSSPEKNKSKIDENNSDKETSLDDVLLKTLKDYDFTEDVINNHIKIENYLADDMMAKLYNSEDKSFNKEMFIEFVVSDLLNDDVVKLSDGIRIEGEDEKSKDIKAITLVGPTGVGKTTTLAKLGAYYGIIQGKKVKFISMDNYRVGAVQQLKIYSEIMEIPFAKVTNIDELKKEIDYDLYDIILIDTAGRSQKTDDEINEIKEFLNIIDDVCVSLVISSTTKYKDLLEIFDKFSVLGYNNIIATKLDETNSFGQVLSALINYGLTLSYISFGQSVPEDLKSASKINLLETLFNY